LGDEVGRFHENGVGTKGGDAGIQYGHRSVENTLAHLEQIRVFLGHFGGEAAKIFPPLRRGERGERLGRGSGGSWMMLCESVADHERYENERAS
jgi:hypothetical protein